MNAGVEIGGATNLFLLGLSVYPVVSNISGINTTEKSNVGDGILMVKSIIPFWDFHKYIIRIRNDLWNKYIRWYRVLGRDNYGHVSFSPSGIFTEIYTTNVLCAIRITGN